MQCQRLTSGRDTRREKGEESVSIEGDREEQVKKYGTTKLEVEPEGREDKRTMEVKSGKETEIDNMEGRHPSV